MSRDKDFISSNDAVFDDWQKNLLEKLSVFGVLPNWDIPQQAYNDLLLLQANWNTHYLVTKNPKNRTQAQVLAKNEARKAFEDALRTFIKAYLTYNPKVSDEDREVLGLPVHKTGRTPAPAIHTTPTAEVTLPSQAVVEIEFRDSESTGKAKPAGAHGVEIAWAILDTPPTSWSELIHSAFDTHTPYRFSFDASDSGKMLYFALRWENTRGEKGPWSRIYNSIIP